MKKKILVMSLVIAFVLPQVVSAAWWNPLSWNIFKRENKTKILEERLQELEKKLEEKESPANYNNLNISTTSTTTITTDINKPYKEKEIEPAPVKFSASNISSSEVRYAKLLNSYKAFEIKVSDSVAQMKLSRLSSKAYGKRYDYAFSFLGNLRYSIRSLSNLTETQRNQTTLDSYENNLSQLKSEFTGNISDFEEENTAYLKQKEDDTVNDSVNNKLNSPECKTWTSALNDIAIKIEPLWSTEKKRHEEYLKTGTYITPDLSTTDKNILTDLYIRQSGIYQEYSYACYGVSPTPTKVTTCHFNSVLNSMTCY